MQIKKEAKLSIIFRLTIMHTVLHKEGKSQAKVRKERQLQTQVGKEDIYILKFAKKDSHKQLSPISEAEKLLSLNRLT